MKTKCFLLCSAFLFISVITTSNAQLKYKIEKVGEKSVKTGKWKGKEIQFIKNEIIIKGHL